MSTTTLTIAERIACSICWLARQKGLPDIHDLRVEVAQRHEGGCDWCDYPLPKLLDLANLDLAPGLAEFSRLPQLSQRTLVMKAMRESA